MQCLEPATRQPRLTFSTTLLFRMASPSPPPASSKRAADADAVEESDSGDDIGASRTRARARAAVVSSSDGVPGQRLLPAAFSDT